MPEVDFSYIQNKLSDAPRLIELSKTNEGKKLLAQITASEIGRFIDKSSIEKVTSQAKYWRSNFTDIVRPNRFSAIMTAGGEFFDLTEFIKSITLPISERNMLVFKRCGKTIKMPLNIDNPNAMNLTFYQDLDNKVLSDLLFLINTYNYDFVNYNDVDNRATYGANLTVFYPVNMITDPKNLTTDFWNKLGADAIHAGIEFGARSLVGNTNFELLDKVLSQDNLQNTGNYETVAKYFNNIGVFKLSIEVTYKNIFIENFQDITFDMERMNTYQELNISMQYQDMEIKVYELDLKNKEKGKIKGDLMNSTDFADKKI